MESDRHSLAPSEKDEEDDFGLRSTFLRDARHKGRREGETQHVELSLRYILVTVSLELMIVVSSN